MICKLFPVFSRVPSSNRFQMKAFNWCRYQGQGQRRGKPGICKTSFAQWWYSKQWSNRELLLLLVENYTQYPALSLAIWPLFSVTQVQLPELNKSTSLDGFTLVFAENWHLTKHLQLVPSLPVVCICFTCQEYFYFLQRPMMASLIHKIKWLWH